MPRPVGIEYHGACCHVMDRGKARQRAFHGDHGDGLLLGKLARWAGAFRMSSRVFCLLPNPFHSYIATPEATLSQSTPCAVRGAAGAVHRRCDPEGLTSPNLRVRALRAGFRLRTRR